MKKIICFEVAYRRVCKYLLKPLFVPCEDTVTPYHYTIYIALTSIMYWAK